MLSNSIPSKAKLMTQITIAKMVKMAISAIMAIIAIAIGNFSMALRGIQLKSINKTSSVMLKSYRSDLLFRGYQKNCNFVIFTPFLQCKNVDSLRPILQKLVYHVTKNF